MRVQLSRFAQGSRAAPPRVATRGVRRLGAWLLRRWMEASGRISLEGFEALCARLGKVSGLGAAPLTDAGDALVALRCLSHAFCATQ